MQKVIKTQETGTITEYPTWKIALEDNDPFQTAEQQEADSYIDAVCTEERYPSR